MIGLSAVPFAIMVPPLATINVEASAPVPDAALIIVPAGIVRVTPSSTATLPFRSHILEASKVVSSVMLPSSVESAKGSTSTELVSLTVIVSVTIIYSTTGSSSEQFKNKFNRGKKISRFLFFILYKIWFKKFIYLIQNYICLTTKNLSKS